MAGVNKVIILGNLGIDPEVRTLENGAKLARLRIATSESYTSKDGQKIEQTEWHTVVVWRQLADIAERYLAKGRQVYIEGKLKTRSWKDQDGNDRYTTEIEGNTLQLVGRAPEGGSNYGEQGAPHAQSNAPQQATPAPVSSLQSDPADDDLPF